MSGNVLDRYTQRTPPAVKPGEIVEPADVLGPFAVLRGFDRALMLEFRMKDGSSTAFNYTYLLKATFDPSDGIALQFGASLVHVIGSNLNLEVRPSIRLFESILRHRVTWIEEADRLKLLEDAPHRVTIDEIKIEA